ncbi:MAG TPA: hypothetical protein VK427_18925, partial [Kofleriaceae bacterium]|nr:hypothetical protein [Kofleriaceae bacterium]
AADDEVVRQRARTAILAYLTVASFLPIAMWNGVRSWPPVIGVFSIAVVMAATAFRFRREPSRSFAEMLAYAVGNAALLVMVARMAGPFVFVPALGCFMVASIMSYPAFVQRPTTLILVILGGFLVPILLELADVIPRTWELANGMLISRAGALSLDGSASITLVVVASVATIVMAGVHAAVLAKADRTAQRQLVMQTWHLRQLLPS